jgi:hypothetical protein
MSSPLEVAFLLANLRAVGLMPDSDFQRLNDALIELIRKRVYNETGLGLADNFIYVNNDDPSTKIPNRSEIFATEDGREFIPYKDWSSRISDDDLWRHIMPLYRRKKRDIDEFSERILREEDYDLADLFNKEDLIESSGYLDPPCIFDDLTAQSFEVSMEASRAQLVALNRKVDALEREITDLRKQGNRSDFRDSHAVMPTQSRNAEDERVKESKIAELQSDLRRELRSAAIYDRDGDVFNAGSARARAASIESRLRSLGA